MTEPLPVVPAAQRMPATEDFPSGPAVGDAFPDFTLRGQRGLEVNLGRARAGRRALIVFQRSSRW
ncbi:MAG: hypothetical protein IT299_00200 [Dehalococcoidia bacterium]|nr:hypothetical protein [Dehalococcoidia bacterium]